MKTMIIGLTVAALVAGVITAGVYFHGRAKVELARVGLEKARIEASLDTQRLIARAYADAQKTIWQVFIVCAGVLAIGMVFAFAMVGRMTDSVVEMGRIAAGAEPKRVSVTTTEPYRVEYDQMRHPMEVM